MSELTKTCDRYDVVRVPFPFTDRKASKIRPALVISSAKHFHVKSGLIIMAMITSVKPHRALLSTDVLIKNFKYAGLPVPSILRFKLFTLDSRLILGRLGKFAEQDQDAVQKKLKEILIL
jgi:mRNA interferase MazF